MAHETRRLLEGSWAGGGVRPVYADFNALTLDITTAALFGTGLPRAQAAEVTGAVLAARRAKLAGSFGNPQAFHDAVVRSMSHAALHAQTCPVLCCWPAGHGVPCIWASCPAAQGKGLAPAGAIRTAFEFFSERAASGFVVPRVAANAGQCGVRRVRAAPGRGGLRRHRPPRRRAGGRTDAGAPRRAA